MNPQNQLSSSIQNEIDKKRAIKEAQEKARKLQVYRKTDSPLMNAQLSGIFSELVQLRKIALSCGLTEELKWGCPCYTFEGRNIVLIHVFKEYCAFLFFKGVLLNDANGILIQQTENVQSARQARLPISRKLLKWLQC